jgi:hypothetical protein
MVETAKGSRVATWLVPMTGSGSSRSPGLWRVSTSHQPASVAVSRAQMSGDPRLLLDAAPMARAVSAATSAQVIAFGSNAGSAPVRSLDVNGEGHFGTG